MYCVRIVITEYEPGQKDPATLVFNEAVEDKWPLEALRKVDQKALDAVIEFRSSSR